MGQWFADWQALAGALLRDLGGAAAPDAGTGGAAGAGSGAGASGAAASGGAAGAAGHGTPAGTGPAGVRLLIKGSRVNRLERVVDTLVHGSTQQTGGH